MILKFGEQRPFLERRFEEVRYLMLQERAADYGRHRKRHFFCVLSIRKLGILDLRPLEHQWHLPKEDSPHITHLLLASSPGSLINLIMVMVCCYYVTISYFLFKSELLPLKLSMNSI